MTDEIKALNFGDWRPIRNAIEEAYRLNGEEVPDNIPTRDWNFAGTAIQCFNDATRPKCTNCKTQLEHFQVIRCLDCKSPLCEICAPGHFWPNGRLKSTHS